MWPLEFGLRTATLVCGHLSPSCTTGGFFDFEVRGHDGAYKGRVHVIFPFVGQKNGKLQDRSCSIDCQQSYNVLVLRVPGLEEGVKHCDRWPEHSFGCWARQANVPSMLPPPPALFQYFLSVYLYFFRSLWLILHPIKLHDLLALLPPQRPTETQRQQHQQRQQQQH